MQEFLIVVGATVAVACVFLLGVWATVAVACVIFTGVIGYCAWKGYIEVKGWEDE